MYKECKYNYEVLFDFLHKIANTEAWIKYKKEQQTIDALFLLDCTESMKKYVIYCKENIKKIAKEIKDKNTDCKIRFGFIGYKDYDG